MVITNITDAWPFSRGVITTVGGKSIYKSGVDERVGIGVWVYIEDRFWGSVSFFLVHVLACFSQLCFYDSFLVWTGIALEHHMGGWGLGADNFFIELYMTMFSASYSDSECCLCFRASSFQISGTVSVGRAEDRGAACNDTQLFIFPGCVLLSINTWCLRHGDGIATAQRFRAQELAEPTEPHHPVPLDHETKTDRAMILSRPDRGSGGETLTRQTQHSPGLHVRAHTRGKRCGRVAGSWRGLAWTWERESAFIRDGAFAPLQARSGTGPEGRRFGAHATGTLPWRATSTWRLLSVRETTKLMP